MISILIKPNARQIEQTVDSSSKGTSMLVYNNKSLSKKSLLQLSRLHSSIQHTMQSQAVALLRKYIYVYVYIDTYVYLSSSGAASFLHSQGILERPHFI